MARTEEQAVLALNGAYGTDVLDFGVAATLTGGPWVALIAKGSTVTTSLTGTWDVLPGALADGEVITGIFTSVTISSGKLYCKRAAEALTELPIATVT